MMSTDPEFIETVPEIARVVGRSRATIMRWIHEHGFPACKLPSGTWFTSRSLINQWIITRAEAQRHARKRSQNRS